MSFNPNDQMMNLKGKSYLPAAARITWFRQEYPLWSIITEPHTINVEKQYAIFRANIMDENGRILATATKMEDAKGFADYVEKAEKGAVSRALALFGFGTEGATEFDEGDRIVDAPQPIQNQQRRSAATEAHYAKDAEVPAQAPQRNLLHEARNRFADTAYKLGYEVTAQDGTFAPKLYGDLFRTVTGIEPGKGTVEDWQKARVELEPAPVEPAPTADPRNAPAPVMFEDEAQPAPVVPMSPMQGGL